MDDEDFNSWKELAEHGLTRPDQVEDMKNWLAVRQSSLDQLHKRWEDQYPNRHPRVNAWRLEMLDLAEFRLDIDKWQLEQFIQSLEDETPN